MNGANEMKIDGSFACNGKNTNNLSLQITKIEKPGESEWFCEIDFYEPFSGTIKIGGASKRNLLEGIAIFINGILDE